MKITFYGAAEVVTGSCYVLEIKNFKIMVDCGMFQGIEVEERNYESFSFSPADIDVVVLTHSHLDHCGLLPKLYKLGFRGTVYATPPTRAITELMLLDSAKVQELRFRDGKKKRYKGWNVGISDASQVSFRKPIYDTTDVMNLMMHFEVLSFKKSKNIAPDIQLTFLRAGHALGAASAKLRILEGRSFKDIVFSGDLGNRTQRLDSVIDYPDSADFVVMESLYGGRFHEDREKAEKEFGEIIVRTYNSNGNIVLPSFTYQRTQELLYTLKVLLEKKKIPEDIKIYLDSPLAIRVTEIYKKYFEYLNPAVISGGRGGNALFSYKNVIALASNRESMRIRKKKGSIIIAGHGMCVGGRVIYHLIENLPDPHSAIIFVGYQADGTLGRQIVDGEKEVMIEGKKVTVRASISRLDAFSAHADHNQLLKWINGVDIKKVRKTFLVHADTTCSIPFQKALARERRVAVIPKCQESFTLE